MCDLSDKLARISFEKFNNLPKSGKPNANEYTILSTIVRETDSQLKVIALGTGSKCLGRNELGAGELVHDSHSEILARRGFLRYLYEEITNSIDKKPSIFSKNRETNRFQLNTNVKFHFFSTQPPCGDASIFPINPETNTIKRRKIEEDINRTGAKCLEGEQQDSKETGINYHEIGSLRYKPGRGDPTLSMSCSDKLSRWLFVGIQGSLLSILLNQPVHLETVCISGTVSVNALERALYKRYLTRTGMDKLINKGLHVPIIRTSSVCFKYGKSEVRENPSPAGIVWCDVPYRPFEVTINGMKLGSTKKTIAQGKHSLMICRKQLAKRFLDVVQSDDNDLGKIFNEEWTYKRLKLKGEIYQMLWMEVKESVFGNWTNKDGKVNDFIVENK